MPSIITFDYDTNKYNPDEPHKVRVTWRIKRVGGVEIHGRWARVKLFGERGETGYQFYPRERKEEAQAFVDTFRGVQSQRERSVAEAMTEYIDEVRTIGSPKGPGKRGAPVKSWRHRRSLLEGIFQLVSADVRRANRGLGRMKARVPVVYQDRPLSDLNVGLAQRFYQARVKTTKPDTHHAELMWAKKFCEWCVERGYLAVNPFAEIYPVGEKSVGKDQLTIDESDRFLDVALADPHIAAFAAAASLMMGVRSNEMVLRTVRDLDANGTLLRIPLGAKKVKTKHSAREIKVPEQLQPKFRALADAASKGLLDPKQSGPSARLFGTLHSNSLLRYVKKLCTKAGVPVVTTHGLRGTNVSNRVESGESVKAVSVDVGHGSTGVTRHNYLRPGAEQTQRALAWEQRLRNRLGTSPEQPSKERTDLGTKGTELSPTNSQPELLH